VNFLDLIWLIPLFPLAGAVLMLLIGKLLDPQPPSDVAVAPGVEQSEAGPRPANHAHHHPGPLQNLIRIICPGMVLVSFIFSAGAVWQLSHLPNRLHQVI